MTAHVLRLPVSIHPLIKEARERMRRRRLLLAVVLAGILALAVGLTLALRPFGSGTFHSRYGAWLPPGVEEVDVRSPTRYGSSPISLRITDPVQVGRVVAWFDRLDRHSRVPPNYGCAGGVVPSVGFTFRDADRKALARALSNSWPTGYCAPIHLTVGAQPETYLYDGDPFVVHPAKSFVERVERLLHVTFAPSGTYLG